MFLSKRFEIIYILNKNEGIFLSFWELKFHPFLKWKDYSNGRTSILLKSDWHSKKRQLGIEINVDITLENAFTLMKLHENCQIYSNLYRKNIEFISNIFYQLNESYLEELKDLSKDTLHNINTTK